MSSFFWYVLHSHPNKEVALRQYVASQNIEVFLPLLRVHPKNLKARHYVPYFPRYLFIHVDSKSIEYSKFKWIPFSTGLVKFGNEPAIVTDHIITSINQYLDRINSQEIEKFRKGDELVIQSGIFAGYEAIFNLQISGSRRVKVLLKMINQGKGLTIELPITQVRKKSDFDFKTISRKY